MSSSLFFFLFFPLTVSSISFIYVVSLLSSSFIESFIKICLFYLTQPSSVSYPQNHKLQNSWGWKQTVKSCGKSLKKFQYLNHWCFAYWQRRTGKHVLSLQMEFGNQKCFPKRVYSMTDHVWAYSHCASPGKFFPCCKRCLRDQHKTQGLYDLQLNWKKGLILPFHTRKCWIPPCMQTTDMHVKHPLSAINKKKYNSAARYTPTTSLLPDQILCWNQGWIFPSLPIQSLLTLISSYIRM